MPWTRSDPAAVVSHLCFAHDPAGLDNAGARRCLLRAPWSPARFT